MGSSIDIKKLTLDELAGVVNLYPWFGGARKELCARMRRMGDSWGREQYAEAAMYVGSRGKLDSMMRTNDPDKWTDADVEELIKAYISETVQVEESSAAEKRKTYAGVGDYFSQEDYDKVRKSDDNVFSRYAAKARQDKPENEVTSTEDLGFYTETLAQIYAEQGYFEQAKHIYSKLILAYPEKSAYFATLIQKMNELN
jgi:tetratricopeptide (TPR) repeat protein